MKKIVFLLAAMMCSLTCMAQTITLNNTANINPSKRFEKVNNEQAASFTTKRLKSDKIALSVINNPDHTYLVDSILVTFIYENKQVADDHLSQIKKGMDYSFKKMSSYSSNIEVINNNKILIIKYQMYNVGYYDFYCYNADNSKVVSGGLQFDVSDKGKASVILDDLLKNIKFTTD